jgi:hypothetical protein
MSQVERDYGVLDVLHNNAGSVDGSESCPSTPPHQAPQRSVNRRPAAYISDENNRDSQLGQRLDFGAVRGRVSHQCRDGRRRSDRSKTTDADLARIRDHDRPTRPIDDGGADLPPVDGEWLVRLPT